MVEIIPKPIKKAPTWQNVLFYASLAFLAIVFIIYFIFGSLLKKSSEQLSNLETEVAKGKTADQQILEDRVLGYQKKIEDFSKLIQNYQKTSIFLDFIQRYTHPKVWFSSVNLTLDDRAVLLGGTAENFQVLGQQFLIFKNNPLIQSINFSNVLIGKDGKIQFNLKIILDQKIFTQKS